MTTCPAGIDRHRSRLQPQTEEYTSFPAALGVPALDDPPRLKAELQAAPPEGGTPNAGRSRNPAGGPKAIDSRREAAESIGIEGDIYTISTAQTQECGTLPTRLTVLIWMLSAA
jgi:hypothetical protein